MRYFRIFSSNLDDKSPIAEIAGREMGTAGLGRMKWCDNVVFVLIANMCGMEREPLCLQQPRCSAPGLPESAGE